MLHVSTHVVTRLEELVKQGQTGILFWMSIQITKMQNNVISPAN